MARPPSQSYLRLMYNNRPIPFLKHFLFLETAVKYTFLFLTRLLGVNIHIIDVGRVPVV